MQLRQLVFVLDNSFQDESPALWDDRGRNLLKIL